MRQDIKRNFTISYHNIFEYPLNKEELFIWRPGNTLGGRFIKTTQIQQKAGYFFLKGKEELVVQRQKRERISNKKIELAARWAKIISLVPTIKMIGLTGALAMKNAKTDSDIDFIIICKKGLLWTTRLIGVLLIDLMGIPRNARGKIAKDHLCLNMWLDEGNLVWPKEDRNYYTAHEIIQITPLINKGRVFTKLILKNSWVKDYWPNATKILRGKDIEIVNKTQKKHLLSQHLDIVISRFIEPIAFRFQYLYMRKKITRELVTPNRAVFHPRDWGQIVKQNLGH